MPAAAPPRRAAVPDLRVLGPADLPALLELDAWAFAQDGVDADPSPAVDAFEWDRFLGAWLPDPSTGAERLAGVCGAHSLQLRLPGGRDAAAAGLTWVGVHPDLRRRGVASALVGRHLDDVRAAGREPVSALFASEPAIYGRFGYGLATRELQLQVGRGAALRDVRGADDVVLVSALLEEGAHLPALAECAERLRTRPGAVSRSPARTRDLFADPPRHRVGTEAKRLLVAVRPGASVEDGGWRGYAVLRRTPKWEPQGAAGEVAVKELAADGPATARALWGRLLDLDLMATVRTPPLPQDDPLLHLLVDPRAAVPRLVDGLFVRVVDVPGALAARGYAAPVDVVLEVGDDLRPAWGGRWRLVAAPGRGAVVERTGDEPALACGVRELGSALLGGESWSAMVAAGLVEERLAGAAAHADAGFSSPVAPHCAHAF